MSSFKMLAATALMAAVPSAMAGSAVINNNCDFPVYVTHSEAGTDGNQVAYQPGQSYNQPIAGSSVCLKVMTSQGFCMSDNCVQLEYTSSPGTLWYDLSNINAGALQKFINKGMTVNVSDPNAQNINCPAGQSAENFRGCQNTYYEWFQNEFSLSAAPESDLTMNLCSGSGSSSSGSSNPVSNIVNSVGGQVSSAMAAAPSVSSAVKSAAPAATTAAAIAPVVPNHQQQQGGQEQGAPVAYVTVTHTINAREEETAAPEKRHIHGHAHHHRH